MTFIPAGSDMSQDRLFDMEKVDKSDVLIRIATAMRAQAEETDQPEYQRLLIRTAISLEAEASGMGDMNILALSSNPTFRRSH